MSQVNNRLNTLIDEEHNNTHHNNRVANWLLPDRPVQPNTNSVVVTTVVTTTSTTTATTIYSQEGRVDGMGVISEYIQLALSKARYEEFGDGSYYAEIPDCPGVWANENSPEQCKSVLAEVLEEWILLKLHDKDELPALEGKSLSVVELPCAP